MEIAKAGGIGKKRSGFDIKNQIFHENNTIRSSIVRYIDDYFDEIIPKYTYCCVENVFFH